MMITKVAVAGGSGNIGRAVVKALVDAKFEVTILSRSSTEFEPGTKVQCVDYSSIDSLVAALTGQDALISTLAYGMIPEGIHFRLVEAAHKAEIYRFIASEFGCDTTNPNVAKVPVFAGKVAIAKRLKEICAQDNRFTWTGVCNGSFLDWGLKVGFIINLKGPSTEIYNGGDVIFSTTTLASVGCAVAGVLMHPAETENRYVYVSEADVTQNQLLGWSGKKDQITLEHMDSQDLETAAFEAIKRNPPDHQMFAVNLIRRAIFSEGYGNQFTTLDNELLGVRKLSEAELIEVVKQYS